MRRFGVVLLLIGLIAVDARPGGAAAAGAAERTSLYGPAYVPFCFSAPPPAPVTTFGSVTFVLQRNGTVRVVDHLMGANPNTTYQVDLWTGDGATFCDMQNLGPITTNSKGVGTGTFVGTLDGSLFEVTDFGSDLTGPNFLLSTPTQIAP